MSSTVPEPSLHATRSQRGSARHAQVTATIVAVLIGVFVLFLAITEEPYHIDELRQVEGYEQDLDEVVELSFAQTQPPLDGVVNAIAQRVIGVGDFQQRLLSVLFGIGSLALVGSLALRNDFGWGSPISVLVLALSPNLVSVTAYARPYALPLFLILALMLTIDLWLDRPRIWVGFLVPVIALLLPLSRTIEPNLALAATAGVLIVGRYLFKAPWIGTIWLPVGSVLASLLLVGVPMILRLGGELGKYTQSASIRTRATRMLTDLPDVLADVIPLWPVFVLVIVLAFVLGPSRRRLTSAWWFWVLVAIPAGFAAVFFLRARVTIPYFDRYAFSWWPPIAIAFGALIGGAFDYSWSPGAGDRGVSRRQVVQLFASATVTLSLLALVWSVRDALTSQSRSDWAAASTAIEEFTPDSTVIIFEHGLDTGAYRPPFYGQPRYLDPSRLILEAGRLLRNPTQVGESQQLALLLRDASPEIAGYTRHPIDDFFSLYVPVTPLVGPSGAVSGLVAIGESLPPEAGAHAVLVAAAILAASGDVTGACDLVDTFSLMGDELGSSIRREAERAGEFGIWLQECTAGSEPTS